MKCAVHAEVEATGFCRNCGKALCPQCTREVKGALYCEECLAATLVAPQRPAGASNPGLAFVLGFIPGLGAVYNGEYVKGLVHLLIWGGLFALGLSETLGDTGTILAWVAFGIFPLYMAIEAYRTARAQEAGQVAPDLFGAARTSVPVGAIVLIGLGVLFLLGNFGLLQEEWFHRGWPVILIGVGVLMLWKRVQR